MPLVIATMAAVVVSRLFEPSSIYKQELQSHGLGWEITVEGRVISREDPENPGQDVEYLDHYNGHRPHRSLSQCRPAGQRERTSLAADVLVICRDRLGRLIHSYELAA